MPQLNVQYPTQPSILKKLARIKMACFLGFSLIIFASFFACDSVLEPTSEFKEFINSELPFVVVYGKDLG